MKKYQNIALTIFIIILILAGLIWFSSLSRQNKDSDLGSTNGVLSSEESFFDFGTISMAAGKIFHTFKIKNVGPEPLTITKIYTSCMCTEATLIKVGVRKGPFGMLSHGSLPKINQTLEPNEEVQIEVVFDPAAHGPAGLGKTQRVVSLENSGKNPKFELSISANVTP